MPETVEERALEIQRSEACDRMRWAGELEAAIDSIRGEIAKAHRRKDLDERSKNMHELQLRYCIDVLKKKRNEYAEEGAELWKQVGA